MWSYAGVEYITSPYIHSRDDSNTFTTGQPYARVDLNPMPESTTLSPRKGLWIWPQLRKRRAVRGEALLRPLTADYKEGFWIYTVQYSI
jgi:hypothetical protein